VRATTATGLYLVVCNGDRAWSIRLPAPDGKKARDFAFALKRDGIDPALKRRSIFPRG
jgi:hypothetical protein